MESPSFADRLTRLFATVHPRGRGPHTPHEAAAAINDEGIVTISSNHVSQLRSGHATNPSPAHAAALARFFHVATHYFSDAAYAEALDQELDHLVALRDAGVRTITHCRVLDPSTDPRTTLASLTESLRLTTPTMDLAAAHTSPDAPADLSPQPTPADTTTEDTAPTAPTRKHPAR